LDAGFLEKFLEETRLGKKGLLLTERALLATRKPSL
jgi:hypothetical protein